MRTGTCPKCKQRNVYVSTVDRRLLSLSHGAIENIEDIRPLIYACSDCGFTESYLADIQTPRDDSPFWTRVSAANEPYR